MLSPSTGIVLNNEMDDFSIPTDISPDHLPPAPANFIEPIKRPLSSMTPIIVTKVQKNTAQLLNVSTRKLYPLTSNIVGLCRITNWLGCLEVVVV